MLLTNISNGISCVVYAGDIHIDACEYFSVMDNIKAVEAVVRNNVIHIIVCFGCGAEGDDADQKVVYGEKTVSNCKQEREKGSTRCK